jgi:hypothetical protein
MTVATSQQSQSEIEQAISLFEQKYVPQNFILDSTPEGLWNAQHLGEVIKESFGGIWSVSNLVEAIGRRARTEWHWRPAAPTAAQLTPEQVAEAAKAQEAIRAAELNQKRIDRQDRDMQNSRNSGRVNHSVKKEEKSEAKEIVKKLVTDHKEQSAQRRCAVLTTVHYHDGRINHLESNKLAKTFVKNPDGSINWQESVALRERMIKTYDKEAHERVNQQ